MDPLEKAEAQIKRLQNHVDEKERLRNRAATAVVLAQEIIAKREQEIEQLRNLVEELAFTIESGAETMRRERKKIARLRNTRRIILL